MEAFIIGIVSLVIVVCTVISHISLYIIKNTKNKKIKAIAQDIDNIDNQIIKYGKMLENSNDATTNGAIKMRIADLQLQKEDKENLLKKVKEN